VKHGSTKGKVGWNEGLSSVTASKEGSGTTSRVAMKKPPRAR
jgi:hypothetical protein